MLRTLARRFAGQSLKRPNYHLIFLKDFSDTKLTVEGNDIDNYFREHLISVSSLTEEAAETGAVVPVTFPQPVLDFKQTGFADELQKVLRKEGFETPTPIQATSWPLVQAGKDVISVARTGSGKTLGFLLPAFHSILQNKKTNRAVKKANAPSVLILAPTRELALQISEEAGKYRIPTFNRGKRMPRHTGRLINTVAVYGGSSRSRQISELSRGRVDVVVATPGRCNDLANMSVLDLSHVSYLVLDEADRMLDMGFEPQIREILEKLPSAEERQSLFFTATWPPEVRNLSREFLRVKEAVQISIGMSGLNGVVDHELCANKAIEQRFHFVESNDAGIMRAKKDALLDLLQSESLNPTSHPRSVEKTIIFVGRKAHCDEIAYILRNENFNADSLHGDKSQSMRSYVMDRFRSGRLQVLVATDVASRGLDVRDVKHVINFDFPDSGVEDYVHRIGRTARGNATGSAHTFLTSSNLSNKSLVNDLIGVLERAEQNVPKELLDAKLKSRRNTRQPPGSFKYRRFGGGGSSNYRPRQRDWKDSDGERGRYNDRGGQFKRSWNRYDNFDRDNRGSFPKDRSSRFTRDKGGFSDRRRHEYNYHDSDEEHELSKSHSAY